ncbi:MAG: hypothetical protein ACOYJX_01180 [Acutalibacteraceae bacterium]
MRKSIKFSAVILAFVFFLLDINIAGIVAPVSTDSIIKTAGSEKSGVTPWTEEISHNGDKAAVIVVPPVIRVANSSYSLSNNALNATDCSTIQTQLIDYTSRTMRPYNTNISVTVPSGATPPLLSVTTQGAGSINVTPVSQSGNPYTWRITGGTAVAGNYIDYTVKYTLNAKQYTQKAASYVDFVELGAGWQNYVVRRNFSDVTHTRHEYTSVLAGSCSTGAGYGVYGHSGTGSYNMATGGGTSGYTAGPGGIYNGMKIWDPGYSGRENCSIWYCGQPGKKPGTNEDNVDGGHRAYLDIYYDPTMVTDLSQLGIKLLYWRSTSPPKTPVMYQEKMIYLQGSTLFSDSSANDPAAASYFYCTDAWSNRTQAISTDPGVLVFNFSGTVLPPDGQKVTYASCIYGNFQQQVHLYTWDAWEITFHVMDKSALRSLIQTEDTAFRQIHDGYTDNSGAFTAYLNALAKAKSVLNQPNASNQQISAAVTNLTNAKNNLQYVPANYSALNTLVNEIYDPATGYRPSPTFDPDYYYFGANRYPSDNYIDITGLQQTLSEIVYGLDIRYQSYVNAAKADLDAVWRCIELKGCNYSVVDEYLSKIEGVNDSNGSPAGNYILANPDKYPNYAGQMLYWRHMVAETYAAWDDAVTGVQLGLKIPDQAAVDAMGNALVTAYEQIELLLADYTELNLARSAAQAVLDAEVYVSNPEGDGHNTNYYAAEYLASINAILDEVEENLPMPEQARVLDWADALYILLNNKQVAPADYTYADIQLNIEAEYEQYGSQVYTASSWDALIAARNAVVPGKTAADQAQVNTWAADIAQARSALEEQTVVLSAENGSSAYIDHEAKFIYGLPADGSLTPGSIDANLKTTDNGQLIITPGGTGSGTGATVELIRIADGKVVSVYSIVLFGDTNGDSFTDGQDAAVIYMLAAGMLTEDDVGDAVYRAADVNQDGVIDTDDALLAEQAGLFLAEISQEQY